MLSTRRTLVLSSGDEVRRESLGNSRGARENHKSGWGMAMAEVNINRKRGLPGTLRRRTLGILGTLIGRRMQ